MSKLFVGFSSVDISPQESVPLAGFGRSSSRMSQGVLDPLYARCMAFSDETGNTAITLALDAANVYSPMPDIRKAVAEAVGLPLDRVMVSASHSHSAPHLSNQKEPSMVRYCESLRQWLIQAAQEALADRKEATVSIGEAMTEGLNFVRRYVRADGTYMGDNYGHTSKSPIVAHESEPDRMVQVVKFTRKDGDDIILANFQGHPHKGAKPNYYMCTSDLVYHFRKTVEEETGCRVAYYSGSSGNVNCHSRIEEENITEDYVAHGKALAKYALEALKNLRPVEAGPVKTAQRIYEGKCNHTEDHKVPQAQEVIARWEGGAKYAEAIAGYEDMFNSPYHAISVTQKANRPETMDVELNCFRIGDFAMVFAPFELFSDLGVSIKEKSPYAKTFVCCYSNRIFSYLPTQAAFDIGGYGPNQCKFVPGTGEKVVEQFVEMLTEIK